MLAEFESFPVRTTVEPDETPPDGIERPKERHPVFYGCYDWHSAVHSHWALIRQLRLLDDHPDESEIVERIDQRFTTENIETEVERFEENASFKKPYGGGGSSISPQSYSSGTVSTRASGRQP